MDTDAADVPLCPVCMDVLAAPAFGSERFQCGHTFHSQCVDIWFGFKGEWQCPMCRTAIAARRIAVNSAYTVVLRIDVTAPWRSLLQALPTDDRFLDLAARCCNSMTLRGMYRFWAGGAAGMPGARAAFLSAKRECGTEYFSWDDTRQFKLEFRCAGVLHRVAISQLHFLFQAAVHGIVDAYETYLDNAPPPPPAPASTKPPPRRQPLIETLIAMRMAGGVF